MEVGFLECHWNENFQRMGCGRKLYLHGVIALSFQIPISLNLALEKHSRGFSRARSKVSVRVSVPGGVGPGTASG